MSQSSTIAFFLLAGFIIFITMKGELPAYAVVVGIGAGTAVSTSTSSTSSSNSESTFDDALAAAGLLTF